MRARGGTPSCTTPHLFFSVVHSLPAAVREGWVACIFTAPILFLHDYEYTGVHSFFCLRGGDGRIGIEPKTEGTVDKSVAWIGTSSDDSAIAYVAKGVKRRDKAPELVEQL